MGRNREALRGGRIGGRPGFTLVEVLVVLVLLALATIPMISAFAPAASSARIEEAEAVFANRARGTLNRVLMLDYARLSTNQGAAVNLSQLFGSAAEAAKERFVLRGVTYTPVVAISDAGGGTGGLLRISVKVGTVELATLRAEY